MATKTADVKPETAKLTESKYRAAELANASGKFNVPKECVIAAFKIAGKTEATLDEAKEIIKKFMEREVK